MININQTKLLLLLVIIFSSTLVKANPPIIHCEIPCGIYDDYLRVHSMLEDALTIEKSCKSIAELAGKTDAQSQNQLIRWVINKENHAQKIITTISDYFLTQRVKPTYEDYTDRLIKHHNVMIAAMKAKQNTDIQYVESLKKAIELLKDYYPEHKH